MTAPEQVLARVFGVSPAELSDASSPDTIESWDSLAQMMMVVELEREYGVSIAPEEAIQIRTVGAVKDLLRNNGLTW
jgi:acyl carrier protein